MENLNLGVELQSLVKNLTLFILAVSGIRQTLEQGYEKLPLAADKLEKVAGETESAAHQVMDILDHLQEGDEASAQLITRLEDMISSHPEAGGVIESLKTIIDRNQQDHSRILETLQFQDLTSQQINYVGSLLEHVKVEMAALLNAFGAPDFVASGPGQAAKAFDPNASFTQDGGKQALADSLVEEARKDREYKKPSA